MALHAYRHVGLLRLASSWEELTHKSTRLDVERLLEYGQTLE